MLYPLHGVEPIAHGVLRAADEYEADAIMMGVSGLDGKKLGSVSEEVVNTATTSVVLIKDLYEVTDSPYKFT